MANAKTGIVHTVSRYYFVRIFFSVLGSFVAVWVIRWMGPEEFGKYGVAVQIPMTIGSLLALGGANTLSRFLPRESEQQKKTLISQYVALSLSLQLLAVLAVSAIAIRFPFILPYEMRRAWAGSLGAGLLVGLEQVLQGMFRGVGQFIAWSALEGGQDVFARIVALGVFYFKGAHYVILLRCILAVMATVTLYGFWKMRRYVSLPSTLVPAKEVQNFAVYMISGQLLYTFANTSDILVLRAFTSAWEVGYYGLGMRVLLLISNYIYGPLVVPLLYYFSHPEYADSKIKILNTGVQTLIVSCGALSLTAFGTARWVLPLVFGPRYLPALPAFEIICSVIFLGSITPLLTQYFVSIHLTRETFLFSLISGLLGFLLNLVLVPRWGARGAGVTLAMVSLFQAFLYIRECRREKIPLYRLSQTILSFCAAFAAGYFFKPFIALPLFLGMVYMFKLLEWDEVKRIVSRFRETWRPAA